MRKLFGVLAVLVWLLLPAADAGLITQSGPRLFVEAGGGDPEPGEDARLSLVVLDDFATLKTANNGSDQWADAYNGAVNDAGPHQTVLGASSGAMQVSVPGWHATGGNHADIFYVDFDSPNYTQANHWLRGHVESGTWNSGINRFSFLIRVNNNLANSQTAGSGDNFNVGTYIKPVDNFSSGAEGSDPQNGHHYYHGLNTRLYSGRWQKVVIDNCPQHERGDAGGVDHTPISEYFHQMTRFYIQYWGVWNVQNSTQDTTTSQFELAALELYQTSGEDNTNIRSMTIQYTGTRYEVTWAGRKSVSHTYDVRYRTDGESMTENGFTSGTNGGTATNPGNDYTSVAWYSSDMSESTSGIYVAVRRQGETAFREIYLPYQVSPTNTAVPVQNVSWTAPPALRNVEELFDMKRAA